MHKWARAEQHGRSWLELPRAGIQRGTARGEPYAAAAAGEQVQSALPWRAKMGARMATTRQCGSAQRASSGLGGKIRSQLNIQMAKVDGVKQAEGLRDILLPMIWFSDDIDELNDQDLVNAIKQRL